MWVVDIIAESLSLLQRESEYPAPPSLNWIIALEVNSDKKEIQTLVETYPAFMSGDIPVSAWVGEHMFWGDTPC